YTNVGATSNFLEPNSGASLTNGLKVWYKFVAPNSGAVTVSTDHSPQGTMTDTRISLIKVGNVNDYSTFTVLEADEDGGVVGNGWNSILSYIGLTPGTTYY